MSAKQVLFIINPNAGRTVVEELRQSLQLALLARRGSNREFAGDFFIPETPEHLREELRARLEQGAVDVVGVVGGDGTIMEVLPVMVDFPKIPLLLLPYGTGNLLAVNLGVPKDLEGALDVLFNGKPRRIDVGKIGNHYFALLAGAGAVADIMENTASCRKKIFGIWAYFVDGLRTIFTLKKGSLFTVIADGRVYKMRGPAVVISNAAGFMGPCLPLTPDAEPDDGLLDVCMIKSRYRRDYIPAIMRILQKLDKNTFDRRINYFQARKLRIESSPPMKVQADGNVIGTTPVDIEIVRNRLQIMVPEEESFDRHPDGEHLLSRIAVRQTHAEMLERLFSSK